MTPKPFDAYRWATNLCARGEHSAAEIAEKARRKGASAAEAEKLVERLTDEGYVSDERFCRAFVHDKLQFDGWGRLKIRAALMQHRIPTDIVSQTMDELIDEEDYMQLLRTTIERKARTTDDTQKIARHAASRGFEPHLILKLLNP